MFVLSYRRRDYRDATSSSRSLSGEKHSISALGHKQTSRHSPSQEVEAAGARLNAGKSRPRRRFLGMVQGSLQDCAALASGPADVPVLPFPLATHFGAGP